MDSMIILYALKYAIKRPTAALSRVSAYVMDNIHEMSNEDLKLIRQELTNYYSEHRDSGNYLIAKKLCVAINRELYSEG